MRKYNVYIFSIFFIKYSGFDYQSVGPHIDYQSIGLPFDLINWAPIWTIIQLGTH